MTLIFTANSFFSTILNLLERYHTFFIRGVMITLLLAVVGTGVGFVFALFMTMVRMQSIDLKRNSWISIVFKKIIRLFVSTYITFFRGTPMIVQAMIFYYGIAPLGLSFWRPLVAGLVCCYFKYNSLYC
jgi:putative lysine transport system permease protein